MNTIKPIQLLLRRSFKILINKFSLAFAVLLFISLRSSAQPVNIFVNPPSTTITVGGSFTVTVAVDFIGTTPPVGVDGVEVHFAFDNTKLQITAMSESATVAAFSSKPIPLEGTPFTTSNTNGQIDYAAATTPGPTMPLNDFTILSITFQVIGGAGTTSPLTLRRDLPFNFTDAQRAGVSNVNAVTNGSVSINAVGCTAPTATISAASTCDANAFNLILASTPAPTGTAPFDLTINGTTYDNIPVGGVITNFAPPVERIWPAPPAPPTSEDASITLGVQFQSSVTGFVKGVRFFSPDEVPIPPGNFTGQLWTAGGVLLASGTFTGVIVDSWNELLFTEPILISAATTYVASYHTNAIKYVGTTGGLTAPVVNGSLTALANGGVFTYGGAVNFPVSTTANNYWADVIFSPNNYTFNLTSIKDALECTSTGAPNLQTLNVTSIDCSTLPVSLINFSATPKNDAVLLRWATSSEIDNLGFELQRSIDGNNGWSAIAFVNGAGNSTSTINYSYVDEKLSARRYYYRLKQIDIDQHFTFSAIVSAILDGKETFGLQQNYPNPFRGETIIRFTLPQKTKINLSIFDMNGRLVKVLVDGSKDSGTHAVTLNSGILTSGLYYYKLQTGDFSAVKKMTIQ